MSCFLFEKDTDLCFPYFSKWRCQRSSGTSLCCVYCAEKRNPWLQKRTEEGECFWYPTNTFDISLVGKHAKRKQPSLRAMTQICFSEEEGATNIIQSEARKASHFEMPTLGLNQEVLTPGWLPSAFVRMPSMRWRRLLPSADLLFYPLRWPWNIILQKHRVKSAKLLFSVPEMVWLRKAEFSEFGSITQDKWPISRQIGRKIWTHCGEGDVFLLKRST